MRLNYKHANDKLHRRLGHVEIWGGGIYILGARFTGKGLEFKC